jgi:hypothetical protein
MALSAYGDQNDPYGLPSGSQSATGQQTNSENQPIRLERSLATGPGLDVSLDFAPALLIGRLSGHLRADAHKHLRDTFRTALRQRPERLVVDASA